MSILSTLEADMGKVETFFEGIGTDIANAEKFTVQKIVSTAKKYWVDVEHVDAVFDAWIDEKIVSALNMTAEEANALKASFAQKLVGAQTEASSTSPSNPAP